MSSLTSLLPQIAPTLGLSRDALYERQRALVRLGLLLTPQGRGRGSGAEATPHTVALLTIAVLVTDNLSDTDERVRKLAEAPYIGKKRDRCPRTGARTFFEALAFLFSPAARIQAWPKTDGHTSVYVYRAEPAASLVRPAGISDFGHRDRKNRGRLEVEAHLPFEAIRAINQKLLLAGAQ